MDYRYLKAFSFAAKQLNFAKAARDLSISPSAVTRQIALLEASVGHELFIRGNKEVLLSEYGVRLAKHLSQFEFHTQSLTQESTLRIGCLESVFEFYLTGLIKKHPKVFSGQIDITIDSPERLGRKIEAGEIDVAITNQAPVSTSTLTAIKLFQEEIRWFGSSKRTIVFSAFENRYDQNEPRSQRIRINSFNGALALAKQGVGKALFAYPTKTKVGRGKAHQWIYAVTPAYQKPPFLLKSVLAVLKKSIES